MTEPTRPTPNPTDDQQAAVANAAAALSPQARSSLVADVIGTLGTSAQRHDAAVAAVSALAPESTPALVADVIGQLDSPVQKQKAAVAAVGALPPADQEQVLSAILGPPDPKTQRVLWLIVISTMAGSIFLFGTLAFVLIVMGKGAEAPLALATTALGGVVGLVATSPVGRRS